MRRNPLKTAVDHLTAYVEDFVKNAWEAIGDFRKNVGDLRLETEKGVLALRADLDRAWSLNESRNAVHRKADEDLQNALQRLNERLSKIEGEPKATVAFAHLAGLNDRIQKLEESGLAITIPVKLFQEIVNKS